MQWASYFSILHHDSLQCWENPTSHIQSLKGERIYTDVMLVYLIVLIRFIWHLSLLATRSASSFTYLYHVLWFHCFMTSKTNNVEATLYIE